MTEYRATYGPTFRIRLAGANITIFCDEEGIEEVFRDKARAFTTYSGHGMALRAVGRAKGDASRILVDRIFPIVARAFGTTDGLSLVAPRYNGEIYFLLSSFASSLDRTPKDVPLKQFVGQNLYRAISIAVFGELFPADSYDDFQLVDDNFPILMSPFSFFALRASRARSRLIHSIRHYLRVAWKGSHLEGASKMATEVYCTLHGASITPTEEAGILLTMIWGLQSNTINTIHWLLAYLLIDRESFSRIRHEIDSVLESNYGRSTKELLSASPTSLGSEQFPLLDSAVKETLRLTIFLPSMREARKGTRITYGSGRNADIPEGSSVFLNLRALHRNKEFGKDGEFFSMERYLPSEKGGKSDASAQTLPFWAFGGGTHLVSGNSAPKRSINPLV